MTVHLLRVLFDSSQDLKTKQKAKPKLLPREQKTFEKQVTGLVPPGGDKAALKPETRLPKSTLGEEDSFTVRSTGNSSLTVNILGEPEGPPVTRSFRFF